MASNCPNEGICHTCGKAGHRARECTAPALPPGDLRLCNNCYKQGHIAVDCTNEKACNNCRKTGHLARDCPNDPICNMCNVAGHVARQCPKSNIIGERGGGGGGGGVRSSGYRDVVCRNCQQLGHMSRDCMGPLMICHNCGGRGHLAYECPSGRFMDRYPRRYWWMADHVLGNLLSLLWFYLKHQLLSFWINWKLKLNESRGVDLKLYVIGMCWCWCGTFIFC